MHNFVRVIDSGIEAFSQIFGNLLKWLPQNIKICSQQAEYWILMGYASSQKMVKAKGGVTAWQVARALPGGYGGPIWAPATHQEGQNVEKNLPKHVKKTFPKKKLKQNVVRVVFRT